MDPLISICIPAYKHTDFIRRLLDSVCLQTCTDFEVILTDDSPDGEVEQLCRSYRDRIPLFYHRNDPRSGTPENWNQGMRRAKGQWIKLMHDDDWFSGVDSLQRFKEAIHKNPEAAFIYSAYRNQHLDHGRMEEVSSGAGGYRLLQRDPAILLSRNLIGPPSVVIHRRDPAIYYDPRLQWLVDIDFYIRFLQNQQAAFIDEALVTIGRSPQQVTEASFRHREVEIPEYFYMLDKHSEKLLKNIRVYDAYWRLFRNLGIRRIAEIREAGYSGDIPVKAARMIRWQSRIPPVVLRVGFLSKTLMAMSYLFSGL